MLTGATSEQIVTAFLRYVEQAQPGRAAPYQAIVEGASWDTPELAVPGCARLLIGFVYDTIERARRRSFREMWLAARESENDAELRRRILDYLSEGDVAPQLQRLAEESTFRFSDWTSAMVDLVRLDDAREWRGSAARLLGSYPDHPGLLLARCVSELIDPMGNLEEASVNLAASIESARSRYGADDAMISATLAWIVQRCHLRKDIDAAVVVQAVGRQHLPGYAATQIPAEKGHPAAAVLTLEARLADAVRLLDSLEKVGGPQ